MGRVIPVTGIVTLVAAFAIAGVATAASASATPPASTITVSPSPAFATVTDNGDAAAHRSNATANHGDNATFTVTYTAGATNPGGTDAQTLTMGVSGDGYFPAHTGGVGDYTSAGGATATCQLAAGATQTCTVEVGDAYPEQLVVGIADSGNDTASPNVGTTVDFNGIHYDACPAFGINDDGTLGTDDCVTQAVSNVVTTVTATYVEGGQPAAGATIDFDLDQTGNNARFYSAQPGSPYITSFIDYDLVRCTTDAAGQCGFTIVDATSDTHVPVEAHPINTGDSKYDEAFGNIYIAFSSASIAPSRLNLVSSKVIAPSSQPTTDVAEPGDAVQNVYQAFGPCTVTSPAHSCTGAPLANQSVTLSVDHGFFTPTCAYPTSEQSDDPPTFNNNNYANCSFNTAPAAGVAVGDLASSGRTITAQTDANGYLVATLGIAKDGDFDQAGTVVASVTAAGVSPQVPGNTHAPTDAACDGGELDYPQIQGGTEDIGHDFDAGCDINSAWTTREQPLVGGTATFSVIPPIRDPHGAFVASENNDDPTATGSNGDVADVDRVDMVVHLTDQFGNLTTAGSASGASLVKTGPGELSQCDAASYTATSACTQGHDRAATEATQSDGTVTQTYTNVAASYNAQQGQTRYQSDTAGINGFNSGYGDPDVSPGHNDGSQSVTLSWNPPVTTFLAYVAGTAQAPAFAVYTEAPASTASTDSLAITYVESITPPHTPTGVTATAGNGAATVSWVAPTNNGGLPITGYDVQYSSNGGSSWTSASSAFRTSTATAQTVTGLANGTTYLFRVAAINAVGTGPYSANSAPVAPSADVPGAPTGVSATPGNQRATVSWNPPTNNGGSAITGYDVEYSANGGSSWNSASASFHTSTAISQTVTGLTNGTAYLFRVAAINPKGMGAYSAPSAPVTPASDHSTISAGPTHSIEFGQSIVLTSTLVDSSASSPIAGATVNLLGRPSNGGPWAKVRSVTTTGAGAATTSVSPKVNTQYEWTYAGDPTHTSALSQPQAVSVSQQVVAQLDKSQRKSGKTVSIFGTVAPGATGERVVLQRRTHGHWSDTKHAARLAKQRMPDGTKALGFDIDFTVGGSGHQTYRVSRAATANNIAGLSDALHLLVT